MKDLDEKFGVIEKRVRALMVRNKSLADRIKELEQELLLARQEVQAAEHYQGKNQQIREKIEKILHTLDSLGTKNGD